MKPLVLTPLGLLPNDDFFLWGMAALTFAQPEPSPVFVATPHYCLSQLGGISKRSKGGRQYKDFRDVLTRLAAVSYHNERFYDPLRKEHRRVDFGFFSVSSPADPISDRAISIYWDQQFFDLCAADAGHFRFDLGTFQLLDPATRRLFMLLRKVFHKRAQIRFNVEHLAVNVLGYSEQRARKKLVASVKWCTDRLIEVGMVKAQSEVEELFSKRGGDVYATFHRGPYLEQEKPERRGKVEDSALYDQLRRVGFDARHIRRLLGTYTKLELERWCDVTLRAVELDQTRPAKRIIKVSPQAFFMDYIKRGVTEPEWFHEDKRAEDRKERDTVIRSGVFHGAGPSDIEREVQRYVLNEGRAHFEELMGEALQSFDATGADSKDAAARAQEAVLRHLRSHVGRAEVA